MAARTTWTSFLPGAMGAATYGTQSFRNCVQEIVKVCGTVDATELTVRQETSIQGNLNAVRSAFNILNIQGRANLEDCTVAGDTVIDGFLETKRTKFADISISTAQIEMRGGEAGNITVRPSSGTLQQKVSILEGAQVRGNIVFESGEGRVFVSEDSVFSGAVTGGTLEGS